MRHASRIATSLAWSNGARRVARAATIARRELARTTDIHHSRLVVREDATWAEPCVLTVRVTSRHPSGHSSQDATRVLDDGRYDAFIVWAEARADGAIELQLTITTGAHKGDVVELRATHLAVRDPFALVATPCTLVVEHGTPRVEP